MEEKKTNDLILKYRECDINKKDGTTVKVVIWYVEINVNGRVVPYDLTLTYNQSEFLQALVL